MKLFKNEYIKYVIKSLLISFLFALFIEVFVCNFRHFESYFYNDEINFTYETSDGLECDENNTCTITNSKNAYIEILDINDVVDNLNIVLSNDDGTSTIAFDIYISDDANEIYFKAGSRTITEYTKSSNYIKINASDNTKKIKLTITSYDSEIFQIEALKANVRVPLMINAVRLIFVMTFIFCLLFIRLASPFHKIKFDNKWAKVLYVIIGIVLALVCYKLTFVNRYTNNIIDMSHNYSQYKVVAESLADGHLYMNLDVPDELLELPNPYDKVYRESLITRYEDYYWDYAYYNGKYYSYFGVLPCLLIYLPYYLITGEHIANNVAISMVFLIYIFAGIHLCYQLCKKYFKNMKLPWFLLITFGLLILSSGLFYAVSYPTFYNIPIFLAVALAMLGLGFWIQSTNGDKLKKRYLLLGSLCIALTSMCRPQVLLSMFFAIPIFWNYVFKKRELFSKKSIKETICLALPFIVIGAVVMYYNYARFGSIFDFGANYNLTTNDMTKRGFKLDRIILGIFSYLFQPTKITVKFPFIESYSVSSSYVGRTISETMRGGYLFSNMICILSLIFWKFKKLISNKTLYNICLCCLIFALVIIIADTEMAGILVRYICDFGWLLSLSTIIILFSVVNKVSNKEILKLIILFIVLALIYNILLFFTEPTLWKSSVDIYWQVYYMFMFWL